MKFKLWLESGEPVLKHEVLPHGRFLIRYLWPGYKRQERYNPHKWDYMPEQFGSLILEPLGDMPRHLFAQESEVDEDFQHRGWGEAMYRYALTIAKQHGYDGIVSDRTGRSNEASGLWKKLKTSEIGDYDVMENITSRG
jgi:ribosomal protein S18 acetylase RimI-like enzyme